MELVAELEFETGATPEQVFRNSCSGLARQANHRIACNEFARWPDFDPDNFAYRVEHQQDTWVHFFAFIPWVFDMRQLDVEDVGDGIVSHGSHRRASRSKKW